MVRCFGAIGVIAYLLGVEWSGEVKKEGQGDYARALDISTHSEEER